MRNSWIGGKRKSIWNLTSSQKSEGSESLSCVCIPDDGRKCQHHRDGVCVGGVVMNQGQESVKLHRRGLEGQPRVGLSDDEVVNHKPMLIAQLHWDGSTSLTLAAFPNNKVLKVGYILNSSLLYSNFLTPVSFMCKICAASSLSTEGRNQMGWDLIKNNQLVLEVLVKLQVRSSVQVKVLVLAWRDTVIKQATPQTWHPSMVPSPSCIANWSLRNPQIWSQEAQEF